MANRKARTSRDAAGASGCKYDVFLNFRGEDTRHNFTDFLYDRLVNAGVHTFRDEEEVPIGDVISDRLAHAINSSTLYIPIFSQTYASSKWCLRELKLIVDNLSSDGRKSIFPIFFLVKPADVKLGTPLNMDAPYKAAFLEHEKKFPDEVEAWKTALGKVDEHKGWVVQKNTSHAMVVKLVVKRVLKKLEIKTKLVTGHLVGVDDRVKDLIEFLDSNHGEVRLIGINGMGGIGKTTLAKVVFNKLSSRFGKRCSFLEDVRNNSLTQGGILQLQKKLLSDIVDSESADNVKDCEQGMRRIGETLIVEKVLIVLDDVDNKEHIKMLIGNYSLHPGSRIMITARDKTMLPDEKFKCKILSYEMQKMDDGPALQLFCRHAFDVDFPSDGYQELSNEIVSSTGGLPLAIEVISSSLKNRDKAVWEETLMSLKNATEEKILKKLKISYDGLDKKHQEIFLDIACFFFNEKMTDAIYMWAGCQLNPIGGIEVLTERCLIKVLDNDKFWMHDQLIALGREIVREDSLRDPRNQTRLWVTEEALDIIRTDVRKDKVQAVEIGGLDEFIEITNEEFERFKNLRLLKFGNGTFAGDFAKCRPKLRWISWGYPPRDFRADNLYLDHVLVFKLDHSDFMDDSKAWDLIKGAWNLKVLSLTECHGITTIPDFSMCLGLEKLTLKQCNRLKEIKSFIRDLQLLIHLEIKRCMELTDLPEEVGALVKLKHFSLSGCSKLRKLPSSLENLTSLIELDLSYTGIAKLPNSIGKLKSLHVLRLSKYGSSGPSCHVWQLPSGISMLVNLEELDLSGCDEMEGKIPSGIGELLSLRILNLSGSRVCRIPRTISRLPHLQTLNLRGCHVLERLPELPTSLTCLLLQSESLLTIPDLSNNANLVELLLSDGSQTTGKSKVITRCNLTWIGWLSRLKRLDLNLLNFPAPSELASLSHLEELTLSHLVLETPVQLPSSLLRLNLKFFSIRWAQSLPSCLKLSNLLNLEFWYGELEDIPLDGLPQLENLTVHDCKLLQRLSIPLNLRKLRQACVACCSELVEIRVGGLSECLKSFFVFQCVSLRRIRGLSYLKNLETLEIKRCNVLTNIEGLDELRSLKHLKVRDIPDDCLAETQERGISMKRDREDISLDTSNKAVEGWIIPNHRTAKDEGITFRNMMVEKHKTLLKNGEKWRKDAANFCMLITTIIVGVSLVASFILPRSIDGVPPLLCKDSHLLFTVSNGLIFLSSMMAILLRIV